jgi:hypothetical protein
MEILLLGTELLHADGRKDQRTYMTKLTAAFGNFANERNCNKIIPLCIPTVYIANKRQLRSYSKSGGALCRWDMLLTKIIRVRRTEAGTRVINIRKSGEEVRSDDRDEWNEAASI